MKATRIQDGSRLLAGTLAVAVVMACSLPGALATGTVGSVVEAKGIALREARLGEPDVMMTHLTENVVNGRRVYRVEFVVSGVLYRYGIDVESGEVVLAETEMAAGSLAALEGSCIQMSSAMDVALAEVGVGQATFTEVALVDVDGGAAYSVELVAAGQAYAVMVDAQDGGVLWVEAR